MRMFPVCVDDLRRLARDKLSADVWEYIDGGSDGELTLAANREAFQRVQFRPRVMVDVSRCPTGTTLLGDPLAAPLGVAPTAYHQMVHGDGEVATAKGAGAAGALFVVSMFASRTVEDIATAATGPLWLQLYWLRRRAALADLVRRAAAAGYRALVLTVDAPRIGRRLRDLRNGFAVQPDIEAVNLDPALMASTHERRTGESAIARHSAQTFDPTLTWADLAWLRDLSDLPVLVKGILTAPDAARAVEAGAAGIIVSNHGGRQLDRAPASLTALVEVIGAVGDACPVLLDGGVRGGADVFAALALGASAVLIGRPTLWALAHNGGAGVADLFELLRIELEHTMALAGRPGLRDIDRDAVRLDGLS
jgi:4-hydroxymandelate oxidase